MNSMISLFLLLISCCLCLSKVLFTIDTADHINLQELLDKLLDTEYVDQDRMDRYTKFEKSFICKSIIESRQFSTYQHLMFIERNGEGVSYYDPYEITYKRLLIFKNKDALPLPLSSFGCLAREKDMEMDDSQPTVEIFVSFGFEDYTFIVSVGKVDENPEEPSNDIFYIGIAEFYVALSEMQVQSVLKDILYTSFGQEFRKPFTKVSLTDYNDQYEDVEPILSRMPLYRRKRVCKIAIGSLHNSRVNVEAVKVIDVKTGILELSNNKAVSIPVLHCESERYDPLYLTPTKRYPAAAHALRLVDRRSSTFVLTSYVIRTVPALSDFYLRNK